MRSTGPVQVERVEFATRSFRSRLSWVALGVGAYPVIAAWSRRPEMDWPYGLFDTVAGTMIPPLPGCTRTRVRLSNCPAEFQTPLGSRDDRMILYLQGGAFIVGGIASHRRLAGSIAAASTARMFAVGYRKMPELPPSVSVEDFVEGYCWLLAQGYTPPQIVIAGDLAGGFFAVMTAVSLRDAGLELPAGLILENPLIDPTPSRRREGAYRTADPLFPHQVFDQFDRMIREAEPSGDTTAPLDSDLSGLPPTLIQVGSHEMLRVDAEDLAAGLVAVGVPAGLEIYRGAVHVFQAFIELLPESRSAIRAMADFAVNCFKTGSAGCRV